MASGSSIFLFLFHLLVGCFSGNVAPYSTQGFRIIPADGSLHSSPAGSGLSVDLLLTESQVKNLLSSEPSTVSWLKTRILHDKHIRSIILRFGEDCSGPHELQNLQTALETVDRIIASFGSKHGVKLSVAFPLSFLEKLDEGNARELFKGIQKSASMIIIRPGVGDDRSEGDQFLRYIVEQPISIHSRREILSSEHLKSTIHDSVFPVTPAPTIVVPGAGGPVTITPTNPALTPVVFPPPNPVIYPTPPVMVPGMATPVTNTVTTYPTTPGAPASTPATPANTPATPAITPVTVPTTNPPATASTSSPAIPGQSWCVAKSGTTETALQSALDYACGIGGADCAQIQMGANCYNPNTLQNHASFAFNSYYQRNPVATSCDFGGTANIVATNPSSGSCVYMTYSQTSAPTTPKTTAPTTTTPTPTPTTESMTPPISTGAVPVPVPGTTGTPPAVLSGYPPAGNPTDFGFAGPPPPPATTTSASSSARPQPYVGCVILFISLVVQDLCYRGRT